MNSADYAKFTAQLQANLTADVRVLGLVGLGSMADKSRRDEYSDHDFYVIVQSGQQEAFRQDLSWLPDVEQIAFQFRETEHGLKVMYTNGHLLEFAVFDEAELRASKSTVYDILLDRSNIAEIMPATLTTEVPARDFQKELLHALSLLQVGAGRYARGEHLSGHIFIKSYTLMHLLPVLIEYVETERPDQLDPLDAFRRFSFAYPELGNELDAIMHLSPIQTAQKLVALIRHYLVPRMPDFPEQAVAVLETYLAQLAD